MKWVKHSEGIDVLNTGVKGIKAFVHYPDGFSSRFRVSICGTLCSDETKFSSQEEARKVATHILKYRLKRALGIMNT